MISQLLLVLLTGLLTSACTLGLAWYVYQRHYRAALDAAVDAKIERLGQVIEQRVRAGVLDAVKDLPSADVVRSATATVTRTGAGIVEDGLNTLFGVRTRGRDSDR